MATLTDVEIYALTLGARISELESHIATLRDMLAEHGVSPAAYEQRFLARVEPARREHVAQLAKVVREELERQAEITRLLRTHESLEQ